MQVLRSRRAHVAVFVMATRAFFGKQGLPVRRDRSCLFMRTSLEEKRGRQQHQRRYKFSTAVFLESSARRRPSSPKPFDMEFPSLLTHPWTKMLPCSELNLRTHLDDKGSSPECFYSVEKRKESCSYKTKVFPFGAYRRKHLSLRKEPDTALHTAAETFPAASASKPRFKIINLAEERRIS